MLHGDKLISENKSICYIVTENLSAIRKGCLTGNYLKTDFSSVFLKKTYVLFLLTSLIYSFRGKLDNMWEMLWYLKMVRLEMGPVKAPAMEAVFV